MGVEDTVKKMDPKLKKLFINIISVLMIITIVYGLIMSLMIYSETGDFWRIINASVLVPVILPLLFLYLGYMILSGKKINPPDTLTSKEKKEIDMPDYFGVRGSIKKQKKEEKPKKSYGTWTCPKCNYLAKGDKCNKCGYER